MKMGLFLYLSLNLISKLAPKVNILLNSGTARRSNAPTSMTA